MKKQKKKKGFRLIHLAIIFVLIYVTVVFNRQRIMMNDLNDQKFNAESEIIQLEEEIKSLRKEMENSDSLEFVERVARDELGMIKPREIIYIDVNNPRNTLLENLKGDK